MPTAALVECVIELYPFSSCFERKALGRRATEGLFCYAHVRTSPERLLEVLCINTCFCPLFPSHLRSLWPVHLYELGFCGRSASAKSE